MRLELLIKHTRLSYEVNFKQDITSFLLIKLYPAIFLLSYNSLIYSIFRQSQPFINISSTSNIKFVPYARRMIFRVQGGGMRRSGGYVD